MEESNTKKLIRSIDKMALKISEQLELIAEDKKNPDGTEVELSGKNIDTFIKMVNIADKIEKFSVIADNLYGISTEITTERTTTITETETETRKPLVELGENPFEKVIQEVKKKKNA